MVSHPAEYPWSSYRHNAQGDLMDGLSPHPLYTALGRSDYERQSAYRELFRFQLDEGLVDQIRQSTNGNYALGSESFKKDVEDALGRRVVAGVDGRPRKNGV